MLRVSGLGYGTRSPVTLLGFVSLQGYLLDVPNRDPAHPSGFRV